MPTPPNRVQAQLPPDLFQRFLKFQEAKGLMKQSAALAVVIKEGLDAIEAREGWYEADEARSRGRGPAAFIKRVVTGQEPADVKAVVDEVLPIPKKTQLPPEAEGLPEVTLEDLELLHKLKALKKAGLL